MELMSLNSLKIVLATFILSLPACQSETDLPLRLAHISWPGYESLSLAKTHGFYNDSEVKIFRSSNNAEVLRALQHDVIDVAAVTLNEAIEIQYRINEPITIIAVLDISHGADVIIANKDIKSVSDLKGKRLGMIPSAFGAFFVSRAIDPNPDISINQIYIVPINITDHKKLFLNKEIDAVATYEPAKSQILKVKGHVIFDSTNIPNQIFDVLITRRAYADKNPQKLIYLLNGHFKALQLLESESSEAISQMAKFENISPLEYKNSLNDIRIPDKEENIRLMTGMASTLVNATKMLQSFLQKKDIVDSNYNTLPDIDTKFILNTETQ